jgi:hypothetical protein
MSVQVLVPGLRCVSPQAPRFEIVFPQRGTGTFCRRTVMVRWPRRRWRGSVLSFLRGENGVGSPFHRARSLGDVPSIAARPRAPFRRSVTLGS